MGEVTAISWCDPWIGCTKVSPACDGCYAEARMDKRFARVKWGAPGKGAGTRSRTSPGNWREPVRWNRKAEIAGTRPFVFCASLADVFDNQVRAEWRADLFDLIRATPNLVWLLLTKRPQLIVRLSEAAGGLPSNTAIGATCEDQERADINVPHLLAAKAKLNPAFAFLSCEPLLGPIQLDDFCDGHKFVDWLRGNWCHDVPDNRVAAISRGHQSIDWVITGGETDQGSHKARPTHPDWLRSLRDQCAAAGVPFHFKQWGEWLPDFESYAGSGHLPDDDPEQSRFLTCVWNDTTKAWERTNGAWDDPEHWLIADDYWQPEQSMTRYGKRYTGRQIEGVEHNARPEVGPT